MIIVIGATGFIGVYTVEHLRKKGHDVFATGSNPVITEYFKTLGVQTVNLRLENEADLHKLPVDGVEGVIVLGGLLPANVPVVLSENDNAADYFRINTAGIANVLEFCRKQGIKKLISTSSYADVMKSWQKDVALSEEEPRNFHYTGDHAAYVISKNAALDIQEYYHQQHGLQTAAFRLPPVYGVGPHGDIYVNGVLRKSGIQTFVEKALASEDIEIWGDPTTSRDIVYVKDVATAFEQALMGENTQGLYNMTSGVAVTLEEQARVVIKLFSPAEHPSNIVYRPELKNSTPSYLFSIAKAQRDFGYNPQFIDFELMMRDYQAELASRRFAAFLDSRAKH